MTIEQMKLKKRLLGLTAAELADGAGVPLPTLQKILSGKTTRPRAATMERLEAYLKKAMELASFGPGSGESSPASESQTMYDTNARPGASSIIRENAVPYHAAPKYPNQGQYTVEDLYEIPELADEDVRIELIDGVIYDMSTPTVPHEIIASELSFLLKECINRQNQNCLVLNNAALCPLPGENTYLVPDVMAICRKDQLTKRWAAGGPEFAAEVLSPSTRAHDMVRKRRKYHAAGVSCLWLIDPEYQMVYADYLRNHGAEKDAADEAFSYETEMYTFDDIIPVRAGSHSCEIDFTKIRDRISYFFP